jgi:hypothetical protein
VLEKVLDHPRILGGYIVDVNNQCSPLDVAELERIDQAKGPSFGQ